MSDTKPREFWIEHHNAIIPSNRLLYSYDKEQVRLGKEYDPDFDKRALIHVIEHSAYEKVCAERGALREKLEIAREALGLWFNPSHITISSRAPTNDDVLALFSSVQIKQKEALAKIDAAKQET